MGEPKIVITGTGRAGTTLLVQVLDALGLDTGLNDGKLTPYGLGVRAGLECRVDDPDGPTVVKDMTLGFRMRTVLEAGSVEIGHVVIPTRRLDVATASRVRASGYGRLPFGRGTLVGTFRATDQREVLVAMRAEILGALADFEVPHTEVEFPRFATDAEYTHDVLGFLAPTATIDDFRAALQSCVRPEMIHETPLTRRERWRARLTTEWMTYVRYPIARFRRWRDPEGSRQRLRVAVAEANAREALAAEREDVPGRPRPAG